MRETLLIQVPTSAEQDYHWCAPGQTQIETLPPSELARLKADFPAARLVALVPAERIVLRHVDLPVRQASKLLQAVPYALEEQLAADVDTLHFALGARQSDGRTPVAVVDRELMRQWLQPLHDAGLLIELMLPDVLALPLHQNGPSLLVEADGRCLLRTGSFEGFATTRSLLPALLQLDAEDELTLIQEGDEALPADLPVRETLRAAHVLQCASDLAEPRRLLNLLQGEFAPKRATDQWLRAARWPAALAASAVLLSTLTLALGNADKSRAYEQLQEQALSSFSQAFPEITRIVDPRIQAEQQLERLRSGGSEDRFLSLLSQSVPALSKIKALQIDGLNFRDGALYMNLSGSDLQALELLRAEFARMAALKLDVQSAQAGSDGVQIRLKVEPA